MDKLLVVTDLHLKSDGGAIIGLDPAARFRSVLDHALAHHPDASAVILCGDLTHFGNTASYQLLADILASCPLPVIPMMGNHDRRDRFRRVFTAAPMTEQGHVQAVMDLPHHRIITLDTLDGPPYPNGHHAGFLCADRLAWLDQALAGAGARMPLVFCHHPPIETGIVGMDQIKLRNGSDLLDRLGGRHAHLFFGHIHRNITGSIKGVPWTTFKSPCHQCPLDLTSKDSHISVDEPAGYGVLLLPEGGVIAHMQDVGVSGVVMADPASG